MAIQSKLKKNYGPKSVATVKLMNNVARISFENGSGDVYEVDKESWPKERPAGKYVVSLNKEANKVVGLSPLPNATYIVHFHQFANRVAEIPQPKIQPGGMRTRRDGQQYMVDDKLVFNALLSVEQPGGIYDGLNILLILPYCFEQYPGTSNVYLSTNSRKDLEKIENFLRFSGLDFAETTIPFQPNVLPWLEEKLKENQKSFMVTLNADGWVDSMAEIPAHLAQAPAKAKKAKKK